MNKKIIKKEIEFAGKKLEFETGELAGLANLAVKVTYGDTVVLATAVAGPLDTTKDYFPLSVGYEERLYASGSIKSSRFVKRDGRPTDDAIVTRRLIDHAIRPLFPSDFKNEVQVVATVLSLDQDSDVEFVAMTATAIVLHASNIPFKGPMTSAKIGFIDGEYVMNPTHKQMHEESDLEMVVSFVGEDQKFLAIECEANVLPDNQILGGIEFARDELKVVLDMMNDFAKEVNPKMEKMEYIPQEISKDLYAEVKEYAHDRLEEIFEKFSEKADREAERSKILEELEAKYEESDYETREIQDAIFLVEKKMIQANILNSNKRPDGRKLTELRDISCRVDILPRTHGSAIFNRGETQALTIATLGNPSAELLVQDMFGERSKKYIHYYNFPPYSTGEVGRMGGAGGREIGHGMLAEKALRPVVPAQEDFPYMVMLQSEIMASNGSTSMAATCGSTLALMDAGVPIKEMVAGISVGLVADVENDKYILLTDIMGLEDFTGHMDFKIAGSENGITAIQLDMKVQGIPMELLPKIFEQSREARLQILDIMKATIDAPKAELSEYAPKMRTVKVQPDQVGMIIGSGGKTIKEIQEKTGTELGIEDDGTVYISGQSAAGVDQAAEIVIGMTKEIEVGEIYEGIIDGITDFGAFVEILPGRTGLLHMSEMSEDFVTNVEDLFAVGDEVKVKVIETSNDGKVSLSVNALKPGYVKKERRGGGRNDRGRGGRGGDRRGGNDRRRR